jgi:hypothetical protein
VADEDYQSAITSGPGGETVADVCLRCGVLVATSHSEVPVDKMTPRQGHDLFHDDLDRLSDRLSAIEERLHDAEQLGPSDG